MKLAAVRIKNYKCIDDSGSFAVRDLTCLAGKNEAGKTAILQALRRLNPVEKTERNFDDLMEYPRGRRYELSQGDETPEVLITEWRLEPADVRAVTNILGPRTLVSRTITVTRRYRTNTATWQVRVREPSVIKHLANTTPRLTPAAKRRVLNHTSVRMLYNSLQNNNSPTIGEQHIIERIEEFRDQRPTLAAIDVLHSRMPYFLYYSNYASLPGRVSVDDISAREHDESLQSEGDRLFFALLSLADTSVSEIKGAGLSEELIAKLEDVSNRLTQEIFKYWTQNRDLGVDFRYDAALPGDPPPFNSGHVFSLRVENKRHGVTVRFDERSAGFVWFFSFLVWFSQMGNIYGDRLIILLDEPGLSLHGKAQGDLLRYMKEQLLSKYQVIYTTHSPFMIDTSDILSVRTVEDVVTKRGQSLGTKIEDRVLSADSDTIFPLRAALGYDLTQSLFVGDHSLLVEGPSDLLYLQWASRQLRADNRSALDPRWTITPVGGISKLGSFVALFGANKLHIAVLCDYHSGEKRKVRDLRDSGLLEESHIFLASDFSGTDEADIEDMLGSRFYTEVVNRCYALDNSQRMSAPDTNGEAPRLIELAKDHFSTVAIEAPMFDHLTPAVYLLEHEAEFQKAVGREQALEQFEQFFEQVNKLLPGH